MLAKKSKLIIVISVLLLAVFLSSFILIQSQDNILNNSQNVINTAGQINNNTQEYVVDKNTGETRTIYWTKGIDAPKMPSDGEVYTKEDRVFRKSSEVIGADTYEYYRYPIENGKGYYDFNKNPARTNIQPQQVAHHCYLAAAMNQVFWWMNQNEYYVNKYIDYIQKGYFLQYPGLRAIDDYELWNQLRTMPTYKFESDRDYYSMDLSSNPIYKNVFGVYLDRDLGYYSDLVWDYFFNGYFHYSPRESGGPKPTAPTNLQSDYRPDPNGGLFYNLLGKQQLTQRRAVSGYDSLSEVLKENLLNGNSVVINYKGAGLASAHAITVYGAEYDEKGNLTRIYMCDSDDFNETDVVEDKKLTGLHARLVTKDDNGQARLSANITNPKTGPVLYEVVTLSLGQDLLEESLNDIEGPIAPKFEYPLADETYAFSTDEARSINVKVLREDKGEYSYQWYEADDLTSKGTKIDKATKSWITPKPIDGVVKYYYCEVTNTKNGHTATSTTNRAKVSVDPNVTHAKKPTASYVNDSLKNYNQYDIVDPLIVNADSLDGGTLSYQWYYRPSVSSSIAAGGGTPIEGAIYPTFYPKSNEYNVAYDYYCEVTNTNLTVNGRKSDSFIPKKAITLVFANKNNLVNAIAPKFQKNLEGEINYNNVGDSPILTVNAVALDNGDLSYQWYKANDISSNGVAIEGANQASYSPAVGHNGTTYYYCKITNTNPIATSNTVASVDSNRTKLVVSGALELSHNANLQSITLSKGKLDKDFNANILDYSVKLSHDIESIDISAVAEHKGALVEGTGKVTLLNGESKVVTIKVIAQDNVTTKEYKITVSRDEVPYVPSNNANLSALGIEGLKLSPDFVSSVLAYEVSVPYEATNVVVTATKENNKAKVEGLGQISFTEDSKTIIVKVTAEDNVTTKEYTITLLREDPPYVPSSNNKLSSLQVEGFTLNPVFSADNTIYDISVPYETRKVNIIAVAQDEKATIEGLGENSVIPGEQNTKVIKVTAEDKSSRNYIIRVKVLPYVKHSNNYLNSLEVENHTITPDFDKTVLKYSLSVPYNTSSINVIASVEDDKAKLSGDGLVAIINKVTTVNVKVVAENGDEKIYVIEITKEEKPIIPEPDKPDPDVKPNPEIPEIVEPDGEKEDLNGEGMPYWSWILIAIATLGVGATIAILIALKRNK